MIAVVLSSFSQEEFVGGTEGELAESQKNYCLVLQLLSWIMKDCFVLLGFDDDDDDDDFARILGNSSRSSTKRPIKRRKERSDSSSYSASADSEVEGDDEGKSFCRSK